ncbi:calcium calmodulin-dependent [Fusarium heterosporum]|uniref:Calcium calmodulin-dependent n=1 Tax=Fusarium heterosporum TaxID=42747 RepID=A0A8H5WJX0_FUSHE|nr:calcium calmodulin-dependent [Fusarium heterosporum]
MPPRRAATARSVMFSLEPLNKHARDIVADPVNQEFVTRRNGSNMIDIAFTLEHRSGLYPSTVGRKGQVKIPRMFVANIQISFELHKETGEIMLVDRSPSQTCYVYYALSDDLIRDFGGFDALALSPTADEIKIIFGGSIRYEFELKWCTRDPIDLEAWKSLANRTGQVQTLKSLPPPARLDSRPTVLGPEESRYLEQKDITVNHVTRTSVIKCLDLYTGHRVAVKTVVDLIPERYRDEGETRKGITTDLDHFLQVEVLVDCFHLVMELQDGDASHLASLQEVKAPRCLFADDDDIGQPLLHQMLQALDYLDSKDIIHRNVQPKNILYRRFDNTYHYRLADFGISTVAPHPLVYDGTGLFVAPEVKDKGFHEAHTTEIDVWSLAASLCWIFDVGYGHLYPFRIDPGIHTIAPEWSHVIGKMLSPLPLYRPSAGKVLNSMFDGEGRVPRE